MGEEYGEQRPFPFFCSFGDPAVIEAVRRGRREEFAALAFQWGVEIPDPQDAGNLCRGQARLGVAGRLAAGATPATVPGPVGGPPPVAGAPRPAAHVRPYCSRRLRVPTGRTGNPQGTILSAHGVCRLHCAATGRRRRTAGRGEPYRECHSTLQRSNSAAEELLLSTEDARYGGARQEPLLPSPFGRGAGGEGVGEGCMRSEESSIPHAARPHPNPLPKGEGTCEALALSQRERGQSTSYFPTNC